MIRRLYVDNFRSLVDFTWEPSAENLVLGANGSGKTTILDALDLIRSWLWGQDRLERLLPREALTRWSDSEIVRLELDLEADDRLFRYRVEIQCLRRPRGNEGIYPRVLSETLALDEIPLITRDLGAVVFSNQEFGTHSNETELRYAVPLGQSAVGFTDSVQNSEHLALFIHTLARMIVVRPIPHVMRHEMQYTDMRADSYFTNVIAWCRFQLQNGAFQREMLGAMKSVWEDFDYLKLDQIGRDRFGLSAVFRNSFGSRRTAGEKEFVLDFQEMSEGERMLVVLYTLAAYQRATPPTTLVIDEPDNFVALAELQPWLLKLLDDRPEGGQIILVSHNPEIIATMGEESVAYFSRESHTAPTRVSRLAPDDTGLSLPERLARGWVAA